MTFILLDNSLEPDGRSYLFEKPLEIISASTLEEARAALARVSAAAREGLFAAGFMSYEFGQAFESRLWPGQDGRAATPHVWFGLFESRRTLSRAEADRWIGAQAKGDFRLSDPKPAMERAAYDAKIARALDYIASGDIYQLNLTFKAKFDFEGDPAALFRHLRRRQKVPYGALIAAPGFHVLSLSPELFLRRRGDAVETRPMKGTSRRGLYAAEDTRLAEGLAADEKSRAENLMIVDLMRNDLGRIAELGGVGVTDLFTVETYQTVLQMTSGVRAKLRPGVDLAAMVASVYPPGSITGAPKVRAMEIIRELEDEPRGVYTGVIGMVEPGGDCVFNVAIRTLWLDGSGRGEIGIGSGVVQDSSATAEYEECLLKMRFLSAPPADFKLIETLRWDAGPGYALLDRHVARLERSAAHFGFAFDEDEARGALAAYAGTLGPGAHRVRLTLDEAGSIDISSLPLEPADAPQRTWRFAIAETRMHSRNPFLYHKTTRRDFYDDERRRMAERSRCDEVIFLNERGELTEGSFTTLFVEKDGRLLTPAVSSGLLAGTLREELLEQGRAAEATLGLRDLAAADAIWLGNSVRGLVKAEPADAFIVRASAERRGPVGVMAAAYAFDGGRRALPVNRA